METKIAERERFERLLTLQLAEGELDQAKEQAARKLSRNLKIKGFRPGKAPRRVVEATVGSKALREEAIELALPRLVTEALRTSELTPATLPRIEEMRDTDGGVEVDVVVTLWPTLDRLPVYEGRKITVLSPEPTDEEVAGQIERLRTQFAELEDVARPAGTDDFVLIDLSASRHGLPLDDISSKDLLYEVGSNSFLDGLDDAVLGAGTGDIKSFEVTLPEGFGEHGGRDATVQVLVKGVRSRKLPDLTDGWVEEVTEFETVDELRSSLQERVAAAKLEAVREEFRSKVLVEVLEDVDLAMPDGLVEAEMEEQLHGFVHRLEASGVSLPDYLRITGQEQDAFVADVRARAERSLRARVLLEAVAAEQGIAVTPGEVDEAVADLAGRAGQETADYRKALEEAGRVESLTGDILRRKALDHVVEAAVPVDADGNAVELGEAEVEAETRPAEKG